jgi:hypothetical protein
MELFTDDVMEDLLSDSLETAKLDGKAWSNPKHGYGSDAGQFPRTPLAGCRLRPSGFRIQRDRLGFDRCGRRASG